MSHKTPNQYSICFHFCNLTHVLHCMKSCNVGFSFLYINHIHSKLASVDLILQGVYIGPHYRVLKVTLEQC